MSLTAIQINKRQSGLSLIELMISMVIGLILLAGTLSIFLSTRQGYGINNAISRVQESGRFALAYIYNDARMAGYMGCATSSHLTNYLNPISGSNLAFDFTTAIKGYEYDSTAPQDYYPTPPGTLAELPTVDANNGDWSPTLDTDLQSRVMPGTDVFLVRFSQGTSPVYITDIPGSPSPGSPSSDFHINVNGGLQTGDLLVVTNCMNAVVLQATQINGSPNGPDTNVTHQTGNGTPGNAIQGLPSAFVGAQVMMQPTTVVFFIGKGVDGSPALFQAVTDASQPNGFSYMELVPQVEDMQVLYGVDLNSNHTPSEYETAAAVDASGEWSNVVSVRVGLLVRSAPGAVHMPATAPTFDLLGTTFTAPKDTRLRKMFTATIALRNRLQ